MPKNAEVAAFNERFRAGPHKVAFDAGFDTWHTGGGCMAFRKDAEDRYWMITDDDNGISANPDDRVWLVGCYPKDEESQEAELWVFVQEPVTLARAVELHSSLPDPVEPEQIILKWENIGADSDNSPRP